MDPLGTVLVLTIFGIKSGVAHEVEFRDVRSCVCPGCELVVECTVTGIATVWQGTVFDGCQNEEITLRHSQFILEGVQLNESCETGVSIVGRSVSAEGGSFVSQLNVTFSEDLNGKTIECANESRQIVGSKQIDIPSALPTSINISVIPPVTIPGALIITWDLVYNDTMNTIGLTWNVTQVYYNVITSNCGMCSATTLSNFTACNLTASNLHVDSLCTVIVIIQVSECGRARNVSSDPYSVDLINLVDGTSMYNDMLTTANLTEWVANRNWSTVFLPLASTGILLMLFALIVVIVVKYKSQHKTCHDQTAFRTEGPTDHSDNPISSDMMMNLGLGQYSLLHHPSEEEGMITYLEIGPSTRYRTEVIASADRVEYAEVNKQSQTLVFKSDADKYLNLDTLLIQVRRQVTPLWYEFGVAAGVPMDTLNKCLNYTPEESIVEVLDYWLRQSKRTWEDVARVLNEINLHELAEKMLKIYDIGLLPMAVVDEAIMNSAITSVSTCVNLEAVSEKSKTPPPP